MSAVLPPESEFNTDAAYAGGHEPGSGWSSEGALKRGRDQARWVRREAQHGFVDFSHVYQPIKKGVGVSEAGVAYARCVLEAPVAMTATLRLTFDDALAIRVNDGSMQLLGEHAAFRTKEIAVQLKRGKNIILVKQSNTIGFNHGGWLFNFQAVAADGERLWPRA